MTRRMQPARAGGNGWAAALVACGLLAAQAAQAGGLRPELTGTLGQDFAVTGTPSEGGPSGSLSALWPVAERVSFGVMLHAADAGAFVDSLRDPDGTVPPKWRPYGRIEQLHRAIWGASWRVDARLPERYGWTAVASATWGYYQIRDDVRGAKRDDIGSTGLSLAAIVRHPLGRHFALGALVRYQQLFNDRTGRYVTAGLDWSWR